MVFDIMDSDNRGIYDINALLRFNEKIEKSYKKWYALWLQRWRPDLSFSEFGVIKIEVIIIIS